MCEFGSQEEDMLRDKVVFGIADQRAKERMLREGNLTLQKALHIAHAADSTRHQMENIKTPAISKQVNAVTKSRFRGKTQARGKSYSQRSQQTKQASTADYSRHDKAAPLTISRKCHYCGSTHSPKRCPAFSVLDACTRTISKQYDSRKNSSH